jgi:hypothetical protein
LTEAKLSERGAPRATAGNINGARAGEATGATASATDATATRAAGAMSLRRSGGALGDARLLLLGVWLGAAIFFSFAVAPSAFAVLPTRESAGALVTRTIGIVNVGGFLLALLLLATAFARVGAATKRARVAEVIALAIVALATGAGHWLIAARMAALRVAMGRPIDAMAASDPLRLDFNSLHGYSVAAMTTAMLAAIVAFVLVARRNRS